MKRTWILVIAALAMALLTAWGLYGVSAEGQKAPGPAGGQKPTPASPPGVPAVCGQMNVVPSPNINADLLNGVSALAGNDIWTVGYYVSNNDRQTLVEHWNGSAWLVFPSENVNNLDNELLGVSAMTSNDVWAVGDYQGQNGFGIQTLVEHWDGSSWYAVSSPSIGYGNNHLRGVSALASNDVWAVGNYNDDISRHDRTLVEHWDGNAWFVVPSPNPGTGADLLDGVSALSGNDVWAAGSYYNGGAEQTLVEHWDGSAWSVVPSPNVGSGGNGLKGVSAQASNDVWAVGYYVNGSVSQTLVEHWDGTAWSVVPSPNPSSVINYLGGVSARAGNDVWVAGDYRNAGGIEQIMVDHWDGSAWSVLSNPNPGTGDNFLNGVSALPGGDVWAIGYYGQVDQTLVERYGGPCGTPTPTPTACTISYSDVHPADYFYQPVLYLACHGVISGYNDGTFRPYTNTTRAQMTKIVVLGFSKAMLTPTGTAFTFTDVTRANPFFSVVETAYADGIVSGYRCGVAPAGPCDAQNRPWFLPFADVTRGQLSKIDVIAAVWTLHNPATPSFSDVAHSSTFYQVIETAVCHGVISGYSDHTFRPFNNATRGQIGKIVYLSIVNPPGGCIP